MSTESSRRVTDRESELIRELYPKLRRFAAVVAPYDMDPDDLLQEALVKTLRSHRLSDLEHPAAYLWTAMSSLATDHRRAAGRRRKAMARFPKVESRWDSYPSDLADLEQLTPRARAVLYLHDIEGIPYAEVAGLLGGRPASMRRTATRARRLLRISLTEEEADARA